MGLGCFEQTDDDDIIQWLLTIGVGVGYVSKQGP